MIRWLLLIILIFSSCTCMEEVSPWAFDELLEEGFEDVPVNNVRPPVIPPAEPPELEPGETLEEVVTEVLFGHALTERTALVVDVPEPAFH